LFKGGGKNTPQHVDLNVAMAIAVEIDNFIANDLMDLVFNSKKDIAGILGKEEHELTQFEIGFFATKGIPKKVLATSIGKRILSSLALAPKETAVDGYYEMLAADIGQMAILLMSTGENNILEDLEKSKIKRTEFKAIAKAFGVGEQFDLLIKEGHIVDKKLTDTNGEQLPRNIAAARQAVLDVAMVQINPALLKDHIQIRKQNSKKNDDDKVQSKLTEKVLESKSRSKAYEDKLNVEVAQNKYITRKPKPKDDRSVRNSKILKVSKSSNEALNKLESEQWEADLGAIDILLEQYKKLGEDDFKKAFGYKSDEEIDEMAFDDKQSAKGKNLQIDMSIEAILDYSEALNSGEIDNAIYFKYFFTKGGRYNMDSSGLQPQGDTLHRFLFYPSKTKSEIDFKNKKHTQQLYAGAAQAFGFDIDGATDEDIFV
jgi:hypothetical protein